MPSGAQPLLPGSGLQLWLQLVPAGPTLNPGIPSSSPMMLPVLTWTPPSIPGSTTPLPTAPLHLVWEGFPYLTFIFSQTRLRESRVSPPHRPVPSSLFSLSAERAAPHPTPSVPTPWSLLPLGTCSRWPSAPPSPLPSHPRSRRGSKQFGNEPQNSLASESLYVFKLSRTSRILCMRLISRAPNWFL